MTATNGTADEVDELPFAEDVDAPPFAEDVPEPIPTDGDQLVATAADNPDDAAPRLALADWLAEQCEYELEEKVRDRVVGVRNLRRVKQIAEKVKHPPCVKMLWASVVLLDVQGMDIPGLSYFDAMTGRAITGVVSCSSTGLYNLGSTITASYGPEGITVMRDNFSTTFIPRSRP